MVVNGLFKKDFAAFFVQTKLFFNISKGPVIIYHPGGRSLDVKDARRGISVIKESPKGGNTKCHMPIYM